MFGALCCQTRSCFMVLAEKQNSETLLKITEKRLKWGSIVTSKCWKAYNCLSEERYQHLTANHSLNLVDPSTFPHKDSFQEIWRKMKRKVLLHGKKRKHCIGYLARSMFCMVHKDPNKRFHQFIGKSAALYNPYEFTKVRIHHLNLHMIFCKLGIPLD